MSLELVIVFLMCIFWLGVGFSWGKKRGKIESDQKWMSVIAEMQGERAVRAQGRLDKALSTLDRSVARENDTEAT